MSVTASHSRRSQYVGYRQNTPMRGTKRIEDAMMVIDAEALAGVEPIANGQALSLDEPDGFASVPDASMTEMLSISLTSHHAKLAGDPADPDAAPPRHLTVTLTNAGPAPIADWSLRVRYTGLLTGVMNARLMQVERACLLVRPEQWNSTIAPGDSVSFDLLVPTGPDPLFDVIHTENGSPSCHELAGPLCKAA